MIINVKVNLLENKAFVLRVRNPSVFYGSSLPAEALAQAGAPSALGTLVCI
jgi:hypothetical protein